MDEVILPEIIYDVTAKGHLARAIYIRKQFVKIDPFQFGLYSALELRNAIERLLFEYLVIIQGEEVSKKLEKEYRADSLRKRIEDIEPELQKKIEFSNLLLFAIDMKPAIVPDLGALSDLYSRINNYLHAWKRPNKTAQNRVWWESLFQVLDEAEEMLTKILAGTIGHVKFNAKGWEEYEAWKHGKLTDEEIIESFRREFRKQR